MRDIRREASSIEPRVPVTISRSPDGASHPQPAAAPSLKIQVAYGKSAREFKEKTSEVDDPYMRSYRSAPRCPNVSESSKRSPAMTWYVDPRIGLDTNDGRAPETAYKTLSHAIKAASEGDKILLAAGAYEQDLPRLVGAARVARVTVGVLGGH
jgi:hypothetical protein